MKKFIRKHSPPDVEGIQQAPVSILKKSRLTDTSIKKSVVITEKREQEAAEEQDLMPNMISEPDSEDSALCLEPGETENDAQGTLGSVGDRERRKWVEKAVPMSNNPYTKENIVRRKRSSNSGDFVSMRPSFETEMDVAGGDITSLYVSMYKRDYYMHPDQHPDLARTSDKTHRREENKSSETMAEFSIFSPHEVHHHERDSSEENPDDSFDPDTDNDDDTGTVPDSGVSEAGSQLSEDVPSEVSTISVTDEIKRFQKEINIVAVENSKFFKWKKERTPSKIGMSSESLSKEAPKIQFNKTDHIQESNDYEEEDSVSNSDKEITVLGIPEERPNLLFVKRENNLVNCANGNERSRQIQPSSHVPPSYLPNGEATDDPPAGSGDESEKDAEDEEEEEGDVVPALPSVRMLTNKFQTIKVDKPTPPARIAHSKAVPAVARTWKKKFNNNNSMQVHSITARSVSRQFRESLKAGKSELVDTIFKLPEAKNISRLQEDTHKPGNNYKDRVDNVVYSSQSPHELYPDGDYIVTRRTAEAIREGGSGDEETRDW